MPRPKGSKNKASPEPIEEVKNDVPAEPEAPKAPEQSEPQPDEWISAFQAAARMKTDETTIKLWVDHGHLKSTNGMISTRSITECRFNRRRFV